MRLVRFQILETKRVIWINPKEVSCVLESESGSTEIYFSGVGKDESAEVSGSVVEAVARITNGEHP